ncbi:glycosyltransferase, partial [Chloroflexota bacterium]
FFICASERQRDWWMGVLEAQGRINPRIYAADPSLRHLVDVVPYGLPSEPPRATRPVLRGVWPGLGRDEQIVLWGGGLWEWLDPLTAIRAIRHLVDRGLGDRIRLVFPGTRHPSPDVVEMPMRTRTLALSEELGLTGRHVFFGNWVPHEDWPAVLQEVDVGLSLHPDTAEARLAYRSRILDYVWAGLPMVVTEGDALSEVVQNHGLGLVVSYGDDIGVAGAILKLLEQPRLAWQEHFARAQAGMTWEQAAQPLIEFCRNPRRTSERHLQGRHPKESSRQELAQALDECNAHAAHLQTLVAGYENGRFIRLMRQLHEWRKKVGLG